MTINLKIELLKVFTLEFNLSSEKEKKKEDKIAKDDTNSKPAAGK